MNVSKCISSEYNQRCESIIDKILRSNIIHIKYDPRGTPKDTKTDFETVFLNLKYWDPPMRSDIQNISTKHSGSQNYITFITTNLHALLYQKLLNSRCR